MTKGTKRSKGGKNESGQTLLLAVLAVIIIVVAIVFLFDLQNIIRTKIKAQTAVDAAALTGAKWQTRTLNAVGEMNIMKACTVLIDDIPAPVNGPYSPDPLREYNDVLCLEEAANLICQMQARIMFAGPLIGYGAAQQAAKNNGINYNEQYSKRLYENYNYVATEDGDIFYGEGVVSNQIFGYEWREPYADMLYSLLQARGGENFGAAVSMNSNWASTVFLASDSQITNGYLTDSHVYSAINSNYWCYIRNLLRENFGPDGFQWWGNIEIVRNNLFRGQSELLSVYLGFSKGESPYYTATASGALYGGNAVDPNLMDDYNVPSGYSRPDESKLWHRNYDDEDPYLCDEDGALITDGDGNCFVYDSDVYDVDLSSGPPYKLYRNLGGGGTVYPDPPLYTNDTDEYWAPLPRISWAVYDTSKWGYYPSEDSTYWERTWDRYLRGDFLDGFRYYGAISRASVMIPATLLSGKWDINKEEDESDYKYLGDALEFGGSGASGGRKINTYAKRLKSTEKGMRQKRLANLHVISLAKPFGRIPTEDGYLTPNTVSMVLPVFEKAVMIPNEMVDSVNDTGEGADYRWEAFKSEYLPTLGSASSLEEMPELMSRLYPEHWNAGWFASYHNALLKLNDPAWRQRGLDWLGAEYSGHDVYDDQGNFIEHVVDMINEDTCDMWRSGGSGGRCGPSVPF